MDIKEFCAARDIDIFIRIYNKGTKYAPFSVPLNKDYLCKYVLKDVDNKNEFIYLCNDEDSEGIIHFGLNPDNKKEGLVYLLIANKNSAARRILEEAQKKLAQSGATFINSFTWYRNPYEFILYGSEAYCWAGLYPANNAFHRLSYDEDADILVMCLHMKERPTVISFNNEDIVIKEVFVRDDELVTYGQFIAYEKGRQVGRSGYYNLKAISKHFHKGFGQIDIWINDEFHGKNMGSHLISLAHQKLYDLKIKQVLLATNQSLFRAVKFYEKLGYIAESIKAYSYSKELSDV